MNLTHQQQDVLRLLVSKHEASGGQPFIFVRSMTGAGLGYPGGDSVPVANDDLDFYQLQHENLITFIPLGPNQWRGKPTELGMAAVRDNFILAANESDDPWKNPFPKGTRAHEIVRDTMLWTKEHLALFHSEMLASMPPEEASSKEFVDHHRKSLAGAFDIWAGAFFRSAGLSDDAADAFEHLLTELEKVMVATAIKRRPSFIPERLHASEVRNRLNERKQYWVGQMLRRVREHKEGGRAKVAPNMGDGSNPNAVKVTEPNAGADSDGVATPTPEEATTAQLGLDNDLPWNKRLRAARTDAKLSRPGAVERLKKHGVQITADAIKKHEEGAAMPRPHVRQGYSVIYKTTEDALFR